MKEFKKLTKDFINDILNTFPEYHDIFTDDEVEFLKINDHDEIRINKVFKYCLNIYPERFFDILYENDEMFTDDSKNTNFFKNIDFKDIWKDISDNTKKIIWKYLQLILFCITNNLNDTTCFKDTAKLFEAIDENELKKKLEEVVSSITDVFECDNSNNLFKNMPGEKSMEDMMKQFTGNKDFEEMMKNVVGSSGEFPGIFEEMMKNSVGPSGEFPDNFEEMMKKMASNKETFGGFPENFEDMMKNMDISGLGGDFFNMMKNMEPKDISKNGKNIPNADDLQDHLKSLMSGKIGQLAQEIADDTAKDMDIGNINNIDDVFSKLFKNPGKLMDMIKKVSSKLDEKLKSGELNETELMKEASELVDKMKNTPGMKNMESMLKKMGMGGKNSKVNMNLFQSMMKQNVKKSSQKDRMLAKLKERQLARQIQKKIKQIQETNAKNANNTNNGTKLDDAYIQKIFNPDNSVMKKTKIKKKKKKKKKNKK
jgi:hypothetical protein